MKPIILVFAVLVLASSCKMQQRAISTTNENAQFSLLSKKVKLEAMDSAKVSTLPTYSDWLKERNEFILIIRGYIAKNDGVVVKSNGWAGFFKYAGPIVGLGGGIVGLLSKTSVVGSIASLVVGTIATLASKSNADNNVAASHECANLLQAQLFKFIGNWGDASNPKTQTELDSYKKDKNDIINFITDKNCFGNGANP